VWNKIGRRAFGWCPRAASACYTGGPDTERPERMELLAQLLEMTGHLKRLYRATVVSEAESQAVIPTIPARR
jgi:hypothetical protein